MYKPLVLAVIIALACATKEFRWDAINAVTPVFNQGSCNCSKAVAGVTCYQTEYYRQTAKLVPMSVQYILDCTGTTDCSAGAIDYKKMDTMMQLIADKGIPRDSDYTYDEKVNPACKSASNLVCPNKVKLYKKHKASTGTMKSWVAKNPVAALLMDPATDLYFNNANYTFSTVTCANNSPKDSELNYGIAVVGYDTNSNWIVQNSKGLGWGSKGYATVTKKKECGLRTRIYRFNWSSGLIVSVLLSVISMFAL